MRIRLNCLACGHVMEFGDAYEDYEGEIRCWVCGAVLEVALREGKLRSMRSQSGVALREREAPGPPEAALPDAGLVRPAPEQEAR